MIQRTSAGFPLSPQQKYLWSVQESGSPALTELALLIDGPLDPGRLRASLETIVASHEVLRTGFERAPGMKYPLQVISEEPSFYWEERDTTADHNLSALARSLATSLRNLGNSNAGVLKACLARMGAHRALLVLSAPALCCDLASLRNVARELIALYADPNSGLADVFQYADYSQWANDLLQQQDADAEQAKSFWTEQNLLGFPPLTLPFEAKPDDRTNAAIHSVRVAVDEQAFTRAEGASWRTEDFLFACWQALLKRFSGQSEFVSFFTSDGRTHDELESAVGLFSKPLPVRINIGEADSTRTLQASLGQLLRNVTERQDYLSSDLLARCPGVGFSIDVSLGPISVESTRFTEQYASGAAHGYHLLLRCVCRTGNWQVDLDYESSAFEPVVVEQYARRFAVLANAAVNNPAAPIERLPCIDDGEREQVASFSSTAADFSLAPIHQLFESQVLRTPERPALRFLDVELTYSELNAQSNRIAHRLRKLGIKANVAVGLCVERSAEMIIGLLGILKAGGCYVPLLTDVPKSRLAHQLSETNAPVLLTQKRFIDRLPSFAGETLFLDEDEDVLAREPDTNPDPINTPDDLVYVIYTSGSTGVPKGVAVRHRGLANYSQFVCSWLKLADHSAGMHFATVSTISADLGNTCIFPALISGGCLHVISYETAMAPNLLAVYLAKHPVDVLKITPSHLKALLQGEDDRQVLPRKYLIFGGEALHWDLVERLQRAGNCAVMNHYGPTEATVGCCTFSPAEADVSPWRPATVPIGRPIANDEIYVLDRNLQPTPIGVAGELCVGGAGLAQGYLNRAEETAARFIAHPFSSTGRLYRTGDLARFLPTGDIEFLGRIDDQVKIRGYRVEPAETESLLKKHPSVREVVTVAYTDGSGDNQLAAYVVGRTRLPADELRRFLQQQLPDYMIPATIVFLDHLPLSANGKVDRRALPSPLEAKHECEFVAPRTQDEEKLAAIWTEVLKLPRVSVTDSFFDLGGHSLLATQIISRIRNTFRVQLPLHSFLETPTIAALAEKIMHAPAAETEDDEIARLLQELEGLSEEEAARLLAAQTGPNGEDKAKSGKASG